PPPGGPVLFVAGGIGQTPFLALGRWWLGPPRSGADPPGPGPATWHGLPARVGEAHGPAARTTITLLYGVRTAALLAGVADFRRAGIDVELATDDGTAGYRGFVTDRPARRL